MKTAILFINLGSPDSCEVADVRKYLGEFLMDEDVITAPFPIRWLLVNGIIKPFRSPQSAEKYKSIWLKEGSPLQVISERFCQRVKEHLKSSDVYFSMRYGTHSISKALGEMLKKRFDRILVIPLYPQFAQATTGSSLKEFYKSLAELRVQNWNPLAVINDPFYSKDFFTKSIAAKIKPELKSDSHILFSYHGLPVSQVRKTAQCCADISCDSCQTGLEKNCYRAQCLKTSELIVKELGLHSNQYTNSFQSRLGPSKWLEPSTDMTLKELPVKGVKNLVVCCPAFVTDCLETLEEINIHGRKTFIEAGGESFQYIPCLNDDESWVQAFCKEITDTLM